MPDTLIIRDLPGLGDGRTVGTTLAAKVQLSIDRLRAFESQALSMHPDGYWLADSGGKDSCCILALAEMAGVKFSAHYNVTGIDPPPLVRFLRQHHPETQWVRSPKTMWQLIVEKRMPPTRRVRYCCEALKEQGGKGRMVILGVRWEESAKRAKRRMVESCRQPGRGRSFLNPIIDWTEADVWGFLRGNAIPYCSLYDEGWDRIADPATLRNKNPANWSSGQAMMAWWLSGDDHDPTDDQPWLFGG